MERSTEIYRLKLALVITVVYFAAEVIGGFLTNSLALLSDAGHMFSDIAALGISLFAFQMARRPATVTRTYGYHRLEILAALVNGLLLWLIVGVIFNAAYNRFYDPPEVQTGGMLVVAILGLGVNIAAGLMLYGSHHESLNIHGAFLHILGDALGSLGAILAGVVMRFTGWYLADPLVSIFIGLLILYSSWNLIRESGSILMQSAPKGLDLDEIRMSIERLGGVHKVHDLHVWTVTSGVFTLSAHAVIDGNENSQQVLNNIEELLRSRYRIEHTTIQLETEDREGDEFQAF
jgi:cobalt-zinc-cadmium efflux system protein